jgi:threonine synthase
MSGVQSIAYELAEQLPKGIDHIFCPAGGGGLLLAVARGFASIVEGGQSACSPVIHCVQPAGNNTIAGPLRGANERAQAVLCTSNISGLQVPNVIDGDEVIAACRRSGGTGHLIEDEEAWTAQYRLSHEEGIFCEPAAAVSVAGLLRAATAGELKTDATFVCLITGSAFKDPPSLDRLAGGNGCALIDLTSLPTWLSR